MSITASANRIRVESAAKNGTLGTQGALNADQIKFDTNISTNNGNLIASPSFQRRKVILRRGEVDEECNIVKSVGGNGITCTMVDDWEVAPASGDAYDILYKIHDCTTLAGCTQTDDIFVLTKRLIIGDGTNFAGLSFNHGEIIRFDDRGPTETALRINNVARLEIGTIKNDRPTFGAILLFTNDTNDETVAEFVNGSIGRLYDFTMASSKREQGVSGLVVTVGATANVNWADSQLYGTDAPFKRRRGRFKDNQGNFMLDVQDIKDSGMWNGWCKSELDESITDAITNDSEPVGAKVRFIFEDV